MLLASGSPLVAGGVSNTMEKTKRVRTLLPFMYERKRIDADKVVTLPYAFAMEMVGSNKVVLLPDEGAAPAPAAPEAPAAAPKGKGDK